LACLFERFVIEFKGREELTAQALFGVGRHECGTIERE
jgi:hypothetical protein